MTNADLVQKLKAKYEIIMQKYLSLGRIHNQGEINSFINEFLNMQTCIDIKMNNKIDMLWSNIYKMDQYL